MKSELQWKINTFADGANSLTFVDQEPYFLIATCYNKMAYIIKASTGEKIDCIQQGINLVPDPIAYKLKQKYLTNPDKKKIITDGEKSSALLYKNKIQRVEYDSELEKITGKSNDWSLNLNVKIIREKYNEKEQKLLHDVGAISTIRTPHNVQIRNFYLQIKI